MSDPSTEIELARAIADWAASRCGGTTDEWLGVAWMAVHEAARNHDPAKAPLRLYAFMIGRRRCMDERMRRLGYRQGQERNRRLWRRVVVSVADEDGGPEPETRDPIAGADDEAHALIRRVPAEHRAIAWMLARGIRKVDIAREFGVSDGRISQRLALIRASLREDGRDAEARRRAECRDTPDPNWSSSLPPRC